MNYLNYRLQKRLFDVLLISPSRHHRKVTAVRYHTVAAEEVFVPSLRYTETKHATLYNKDTDQWQIRSTININRAAFILPTHVQRYYLLNNTNKAEESRSNHFHQLKPRFSKVASCRKRKTAESRSMVVEALMSCVADARASIYPSKAPGPIEKRPRNIARSPLRVRSRRKKSSRIQKSSL